MTNTNLLQAMGRIDPKLIADAAPDVSQKKDTITYERKKKNGWLKWGAMAACFGLILTVAMMALPGILKGPESVMPPPILDPGPVVSNDDEPTGTDPIQPSDAQTIIINWDNVAVNEIADMISATSRPYDPNLYGEETWGEEEIVAYYGWDLAPDYIPEGLSDGGRAVTANGIWRERATGEIVADQVSRGFLSDSWEAGSVSPSRITVTASKLGILHCYIRPDGESKTTDFGGVPVTLNHYYEYYDIYVASFTLDGVEYEIQTQRLELEELIKIVASVINVPSSGSFTVG